MEGAALVLANWKIDPALFAGPETPLAEIAEIGTGSTPSRTNAAYFGGEVNWALTAEVDETEIFQTAETLTAQAVADYALRIYPPDTILVAMYGQGKTRGKAALVAFPPPSPKTALASSSAARTCCRATSITSSARCMKSSAVRNTAAAACHI